MKYSDYDRSIANRIVIVVIIIIAVIAVGAFAKVMIDHIAGGSTLVEGEEYCENEGAKIAIEDCGMYNGNNPKCEPKPKEDEE